MNLLNEVHIDTRWGYKTFELYLGDITDLEAVDLLAVSAFVGAYSPDPGSVIGALHSRRGISVRGLFNHRAFDLRGPFSCWVSDAITNGEIRRIVCVEVDRTRFEIEEVVENLFVVLAMLEAKGIEIRDLVLPVLGAGLMRLDPATVIRPLLHQAKNHFLGFRWPRRIRFVEIDPGRAGQLSDAMDDALSRVKVVSPTGGLVAEIRGRILNHIDNCPTFVGEPDSKLLADLRRKVADDASTAHDIGMVGRKLAECLVVRLLEGDQSGSLYSKLERVRKMDNRIAAEWILVYMHVLRVLGNESAHVDFHSARIPSSIDVSDVELCLLCVDQVLSFWLELESCEPLAT